MQISKLRRMHKGLGSVLLLIGLLAFQGPLWAFDEDPGGARCGTGRIIGILQIDPALQPHLWEKIPGLDTLVAYIVCDGFAVSVHLEGKDFNPVLVDAGEWEWVRTGDHYLLIISGFDSAMTVRDLLDDQRFFSVPPDEIDKDDPQACCVPPLPRHPACDEKGYPILDVTGKSGCEPPGSCCLLRPDPPYCKHVL